MKKITLAVEGMTCSACSSGLENYLKKQQGVLDVSVNLVLSFATISYENISVQKLEQYILDAGFKSLGEFQETGTLNNKNQDIKKLIVMTACILIVTFLSMGHMLTGIKWHEENPIFSGTILCLFTCVFLWYGRDILRSGFKNLIHKMPNMDTLVLCSVGFSFIYSVYALIQIILGNVSYLVELSFESSCMVIYFMKLGRMIEKSSRDKAKLAIQNLVQITPNKALLKEGKTYREISLDEVKQGDILISRAGEKIAVDGIVTSGKSYVDESFITGESVPILKERKASVVAGSICYDGTLEYKAEKIGKDSTISEIVKLVVNATSSKNKIERLADKISGYFVPCVILLAFATFLFYLFLGKEVGDCLSIAVTILVVACPCALGLAVPLVSVVSNGLCAKQGIVVKSSEVFEIAKEIDTIVFDKTGTLTYGRPKIYQNCNYSSFPDEELLKIVASIEAKSNHPIASAFSKEDLLEVKDFQIIEGCGVSGKINAQTYFLGNKQLLEKYHLKDTNTDYETLIEEGCSIIYIFSKDKILGLIGIKDIIREDISKVLLEFQKRKIQTIMLTGDNQITANKIGESLALSKIIADTLPNEKAAVIQKLVEEGHRVMMVGDGINDAPALVSADIGVSIHEGTNIAMDSASIILMNNKISRILNFLDISKSAYQIIRQNLFWAFFYNICMIPIAMGALSHFGIIMNPVYGSIAMIISSLTVVLNSLKLNKKGKKKYEL